MQTYALGHPRHRVLHVIGSTSIFLMVVNALVAGTLGALIASAAGAGPAIVSVAGVLMGGGCALGHLLLARRVFASVGPDVRFPTPGIM